jgi:hypothetical protein
MSSSEISPAVASTVLQKSSTASVCPAGLIPVLRRTAPSTARSRRALRVETGTSAGGLEGTGGAGAGTRQDPTGVVNNPRRVKGSGMLDGGDNPLTRQHHGASCHLVDRAEVLLARPGSTRCIIG